ncbi:MAG: ribosome silencing factor [Acidimicrobiales bacterium]
MPSSRCWSEATTAWRAADRPGARLCEQQSELEEHELNDEELRRWVQLAVDAAEDKLGRDTDAFFVGEVLAITDWFVVTAGGNPRQVRAIVEEVEEQLTKAGGPKPVRIEGKDTLNWVLMDFGAFVVHVFSEDAREYYDLERLWSDVPRLTDVA